MDIRESKLLANFMEFEKPIFMLGAEDEGQYYCNIVGAFGHYIPENMKFSDSWIWLMPVVHKIESLEDSPQFMHRETFIQFQKVLSLPIYTPIEKVYKAVIVFIKWYNDYILIKK